MCEENKIYVCPICCAYESNKLISLSLHYRRIHKKTSKELYIALFCDGAEPTCGCGCGTKVKFHTIEKGFSQYAWGHAAAVPGKNNWGNNPEVLNKSHETVRKMIANGEHKPFFEKETGEHWAKGKTKETCPSLERHWTKEQKEKMSKIIKTCIVNGILPILSGSSHPQWKDGTSSLHAYCHGNKKLYDEWKYPKLVSSGFSCELCGSSNNLNVHHDKEKMCDIIRKLAIELGWTEEVCTKEILNEEKKN